MVKRGSDQVKGSNSSVENLVILIIMIIIVIIIMFIIIVYSYHLRSFGF